jgi:hypothetical protein
MKYYTLIIIIFLGFGSCKKENVDNFCHNSTLIHNIADGDLPVQELTYNSNCLIYESIERFSYKKYSYDAQNRLLKLEQAFLFDPLSCYMNPGSANETYTDPKKAKIMQYSEFEYDTTGRLTRRLNYFLNSGVDQLVSYQTYAYNNNQIVKLSICNPQGQLNQYHDYQYDGNGNITRDDYYLVEMGADAKLQSHTIFELDDKNNPYIIFAGEGDPGIYTNKNNILKETSTFYNAGEESHNSIQNNFEYNTLGYPVKVNDLEYSYFE